MTEPVPVPVTTRRRVQKAFTKPSRTLQSFVGPSDIHAIMRKYQSTGNIQLLLQRRPEDARYGDFHRSEDYLESLSKVREAQRLFDEMPSDIRAAVHNDPAELLRLVYDPSPEGRARCVELGLIPAPEVPAPAPAPVTPSAPAAPAGPTAPAGPV